MSDMKSRVTQITIVPGGEPIFSDQAYTLTIEDDAGGEYITIRSLAEHAKAGEVSVDPQEWPYLRAAVDRMFDEIQRGAGDE